MYSSFNIFRYCQIRCYYIQRCLIQYYRKSEFIIFILYYYIITLFVQNLHTIEFVTSSQSIIPELSQRHNVEADRGCRPTFYELTHVYRYKFKNGDIRRDICQKWTHTFGNRLIFYCFIGSVDKDALFSIIKLLISHQNEHFSFITVILYWHLDNPHLYN